MCVATYMVSIYLSTPPSSLYACPIGSVSRGNADWREGCLPTPCPTVGGSALSLTHPIHSAESHITDLAHALKECGCLELLVQMPVLS